MIYQAPAMSSIKKSSRILPRNLQQNISNSSTFGVKDKYGAEASSEQLPEKCKLRWSREHVKEGLVHVEESQFSGVIKSEPISVHYEIDPKPFASGQWTKVYRCQSKSTGIQYAAKYSSKARFNVDCSTELHHEIALLSLCSQSPRVVHLHDVYETSKEIILVMEYAPGGDLQTLIDGDLVPLESDVVHFIKQLVEGLAYLHDRNIAHLDIKPQNLVMMGSFPECDIKLCDFEISRVVLEGMEVREILGTPDYVAPEILHYEPITLAADMWSLGVTTYVLLTGFSPFGGETDQETFQNISTGEVDFPEELFEDISSQAKDFVTKLLVLDPSARMSAKQCLRHEWLRDTPNQVSPHLRRYLSKSREVLLERVVSRENLRRAALMSQATSQINLSEAEVEMHGLTCGLSQSEMCLNYSRTGSPSNLTTSKCYLSPADSQASLNSSQTNLATSQVSLAHNQGYLLDKEQTQSLLNQVQSRSQANLTNITRRGLLSRIRSLNQMQSQGSLLGGKISLQKELNPLIGSRSQEKLYGLKSLSKSQDVLNIYRSLESIKKSNTNKSHQKDVDNIPAIFKQLREEHVCTTKPIERCESAAEIIGRYADREETKITNKEEIDIEEKMKRNFNLEKRDLLIIKKDNKSQNSEENLDSLQSIESDTLTEDSDETSLNSIKLSAKQSSSRKYSHSSSHSNSSANSDDKDDNVELKNSEPKYTVAQLVSVFNKHQESASKPNFQLTVSDEKVDGISSATPKSPRVGRKQSDGGIERRNVPRKISHKHIKNWEELRKQNEKNEAVIRDFKDDCDGKSEDENDRNKNDSTSENESKDYIHHNSFRDLLSDQSERSSYQKDSREKYEATLGNLSKNINRNKDDSVKPMISTTVTESFPKFNRYSSYISSSQKELLPSFIYPKLLPLKDEKGAPQNNAEPKKFSKKKTQLQINKDTTVNLKDILQKTDNSQLNQKKNLEKLKRQMSITKNIVNEMSADDSIASAASNRIKSESSEMLIENCNEDQAKSQVPLLFMKSSPVTNENGLNVFNQQSDGEINLKGTRLRDDKEESKIIKKGFRLTERHDDKKSSIALEEKRTGNKLGAETYIKAMDRINRRSEGAKKSNVINLSSSERNKQRYCTSFSGNYS
ncbi:probable serine/threonine-protein kinase MARK-A [Chelonus insularis]|uniref:probable serine/threonine-protein kinase MARK-A n=1 Tax=Chelonus insularis TaxID=460826 RepID=UPI00158BB077|nr:probable serine/threonine-protein kinase MARK-A [Chelonus insularis]